MGGKMHTPWGVAQETQQLEEGVFWVETAGYGGLLIETAQAKATLSEKALRIGRPWHDFIAFEQEHDMMVVFYEHPEWYLWAEEELTEKLAEDSIRQHHPQYFSP